MNEQKIKVGDVVIPNVGIKKGEIGRVVSIGTNPALPVAVIFSIEGSEWDWKESELVIIKRGWEYERTKGEKETKGVGI